MTRAEQLTFCGVCQNRTFNPKQGIICGLTNDLPTFSETCDEYLEDEKEKSIKITEQTEVAKENNSHVRKARVVLMLISVFSIGLGVYYQINFPKLINMNIDLIYGFAFLGFFIWSFWQPKVAFTLALVFYIIILIVFSFVDIIYLYMGWVWKIIIISLLSLGIKYANPSTDKGA